MSTGNAGKFDFVKLLWFENEVEVAAFSSMCGGIAEAACI